MFALARKMVFGLLATTLVIGTAQVAMAHSKSHDPIHDKHHNDRHGPVVVIHPGSHYYHGSAVVIQPVGPAYFTNLAPATEILLVNPAANQVTMKYTLNGGPVQLLPPGSTVAIHRESVISFDRGGTIGWGRYSLTCGVYKFIPANGVWTLVR
jgi:hypothetical protein